ncbi:MAG TPA: ABC transporter permease [Candidatus Angelobacter sp.]
MNSLLQDLRYGSRMLRKSLGFTAVAVLTLALGIGANTAIFSIVNAVLLRPLPFPQPDRLMFLTEMAQRSNGTLAEGAISYPDFFDWRSQNRVFSNLACYHSDDFTLTGKQQPLHLPGFTVSSDFFSVLGELPMLGRAFRPEEEKPGSRVVVLSHELWQSVYGGDRNIIGRAITLNQKSYQVIGVMPAGFAFPPDANPPKLWRTLAVDSEISPGEHSAVTSERGAHFLGAIGRLKDGTSMVQAREEMNLIAQALAKQYPDTNKRHPAIAVKPELEHLVGNTRPALLVLVLSVGCVLLIACANVANLLLARVGRRNVEIALRVALGARRLRIVTQLLTESLLLSLGGAALAIPLASWAIRLFLKFSPESVPRMANAGLDGQVIAFTAVVALATSLIFGLVPALRSANPNLLQFMKNGGRGASAGKAHQRLRGALVVAETAIGLVLLVCAGLLLRSFHRLTAVDPGFDPRNMLTFNFDLPEAKYNSDQQVQFYDEVLRRLQFLPGVKSVAAVAPLPLSNDALIITFQIVGRPVPRSDEPFADLRFSSPGYFRTVGIPVLHGRDFNQRDDKKATQVVIVNDAFAKRFFPNEDPIGRHIIPGIGEDGKEVTREIVGVVGNVKHRSLSADFTPEYYLPLAQSPGSTMTICLRTSDDPASLTPAARHTVSAMDPDLPLYGVKTMENYVSASVAQPRLQAMLLEAFGVLALVLTAIGIYGVVAYSVAQRTHEIGIRMTLGATRSDVMEMVLKSGLRLNALGVLLGVVGAVLVTRGFSSLNSMLFHVNPLDAVTFASVIGILAIVSLLASYIPAWRATKVDPMIALRYE